MRRIASSLLVLSLAACASSNMRSTHVSVEQLDACVEARQTRSATIESAYREGSGLLVSVLDRVPCNMHAVKPSVKIDGGAVEVSWKWVFVPPNEAMKCLCGRRLLFRVDDAPDGELSVTAIAR